MVIDITDQNFEKEVLKSGIPIVVDFWVPHCVPCQIVARVIEGLAGDYQGKIAFGKINVDENSTIAMRYQVMSTPTLIIFKNGQLVDRKIGTIPRTALESELARYLEQGGNKPG